MFKVLDKLVILKFVVVVLHLAAGSSQRRILGFSVPRQLKMGLTLQLVTLLSAQISALKTVVYFRLPILNWAG